MKNQSAFYVVVKGLVQGVNFRYYVLRHARELSVAGYTRNLDDGSVEVIAEGGREDLELLLRLIETGPRSARVDRMDVKWTTYTGAYGEFEIML